MSETRPDFIPFIPSHLPGPFHPPSAQRTGTKRLGRAKAQPSGSGSTRTQNQATYETVLSATPRMGTRQFSGQLYCVERNAIPLDQAAPGKG